MTPTGTASSAASTRLICAPNSGASCSRGNFARRTGPRARRRIAIEPTDFDGDGSEELYASSKSLTALLRPADGGTLAALDFRPGAVTLINSMQRRPEAYHSRLRDASSAPSGGQVASIHDQVRSKEDGLNPFLRYDRWPRNAFRLLLFPAGKTFNDYQELKLEENAALASGSYGVLEIGPDSLSMECEVPCPDCASAGRPFGAASLHQTLCLCAGKHALPAALHHAAFLRQHAGPSGAGRNGNRSEFSGAARAGPLLRNPLGTASAGLVRSLKGIGDRFAVKGGDEWQNIAATIEAPGAQELWITPIETISESEEGFDASIRDRKSWPSGRWSCSPPSPGPARSVWPWRPPAKPAPDSLRE